ncbi:polyadenylate-binding protein 2-like [Phaseolus vulgaris]
MAQIPDQHRSEPTLTNMSLFVGDLDQNINEQQLHDLFNDVGQVVSVRICKDYQTKTSLGYGYVNFSSAQHAAKALDVLNFTPLNGKPIRVMYSIRDPSFRNSGIANVYIKNLDKSIDDKCLFDVFSSFGNILSQRVARDASGESRGYGFVQFETEASAKEAIQKLNGMLLNNKQLYVGPFVRKEDRESFHGTDAKFNNVYVSNLSKTLTDADLQIIFGEYGTITSAVVMKDVVGESKGFGFVNFANADDAAKARDSLDGIFVCGQKWYVGRAMRKSERELDVKGVLNRKPYFPKEDTNLYIKNLDDSIGDEELKEYFSEFGAITSACVMRDANGFSKGSGFVAYTDKEAANRALESMNGRMVAGKPLYVAIAQTKEERKARLQALFSEPRASPTVPNLAPQHPMYTIRAPGLEPPFLHRQTHPDFITQASINLQQHLARGLTPTGPPITNFYAVHGHPQPGGYLQEAPVQPLMLHPQMLPTGNFYQGPPGPNMQNIHPAGVPGEMILFGCVPPVPLQALASAVANANPELKRILLGESLYPLVEKLEPDAASRVTGMLLEMDHPEVLHLIESPRALSAKVAEAMASLIQVEEQQPSCPADELGFVSLDDDPWF